MLTQQQFSHFTDLLSQANLPLLVVFYSPLCGPSHLMDAVLKEVEEQMQDRLKIVKLDIDAYPSLASQYQVHAIPALMLFKGRELIARIEDERTENLLPASRLMQQLAAYL
jgi:thioredoxin-like negative regulator of GroEL